MRPRTNAQLLRRAATPRLLLSARRRHLCTPPAGAGNATFAAWAPRVALAAVPISVGAGLYVWRNWDNGSDARSRATAWTTGEIPRSQFESRYRLKKSLGKGGFGEVWLALDVSSGKEVAIKVLSMKQLPRSMVEQEITAMQRCGRHPNVVDVLSRVRRKDLAADRCCTLSSPYVPLPTARTQEHNHMARQDTWQASCSLLTQHPRGTFCSADLPSLPPFAPPRAAAPRTGAPRHPQTLLLPTRAASSTVTSNLRTSLRVRRQGVDGGAHRLWHGRCAGGTGAKVSSGGRIGTWSYWAPSSSTSSHTTSLSTCGHSASYSTSYSSASPV